MNVFTVSDEQRIRREQAAADLLGRMAQTSEERDAAHLYAAKTDEAIEQMRYAHNGGRLPENRFDEMKIAIETITGGANTVLFDDIGMPSIMVAMPKQTIGGPQKKTSKPEYTLIGDYETALGMDVIINHVGDCFD